MAVTVIEAEGAPDLDPGERGFIVQGTCSKAEAEAAVRRALVGGAVGQVVAGVPVTEAAAGAGDGRIELRRPPWNALEENPDRCIWIAKTVATPAAR